MTEPNDWKAAIATLCGGPTLADIHRYLAGRKWDYSVAGLWIECTGEYRLDIQIFLSGWRRPVYGGWDRDLQQPITDPLEALSRALLEAVDAHGEVTE